MSLPLRKRLKARMLFALVSPRVVSAVTGGPYHGTPSSVLIVRWPLWGFAAEAGGQTPFAPAWMCIACLASSRPSAVALTVSWSPLRRMVTAPAPVTWLVGTGPRVLLSGSPGGGGLAPAFAPVDAVGLLSPPPETSTTTTTMAIAATATAPRTAASPRRPRDGGGPDGPPGWDGAAGGVEAPSGATEAAAGIEAAGADAAGADAAGVETGNGGVE